MSLAESVERARELLRRSRRISLRLLRRELGLDDEALGLLVEELTDVQQVAVRQGGEGAARGAGRMSRPSCGRACRDAALDRALAQGSE